MPLSLSYPHRYFPPTVPVPKHMGSLVSCLYPYPTHTGIFLHVSLSQTHGFPASIPVLHTPLIFSTCPYPKHTGSLVPCLYPCPTHTVNFLHVSLSETHGFTASILVLHTANFLHLSLSQTHGFPASIPVLYTPLISSSSSLSLSQTQVSLAFCLCASPQTLVCPSLCARPWPRH